MTNTSENPTAPQGEVELILPTTELKPVQEIVVESDEKKLTPKQAQFVVEYLVDMNGTQAAIRAGYSINTAQQIASELLLKPLIAKAIKEQMDARAQRTLITADWILNQIKLVAGRCMQAEPVMFFNKLTGEWEQAKDEDGKLIYQFDSAGANKALENLARNLKLLTDKTEIGNLDGSNFQFPGIKEAFVESPDALKDLSLKEPDGQ